MSKKIYHIDFEARVLKMVTIEAEDGKEAREIAQKIIEEDTVFFEADNYDRNDFVDVHVQDVWEKLEGGGFTNVHYENHD